MQKISPLYEGKAKKVWTTEDPQLLILEYKDDATAGNGAKKGTILHKGMVNNHVTNQMMQVLQQAGIPTHFVKQLSDRETLVKHVTIVPLEVIVRNIVAGSLSGRIGLPEGTLMKKPILEFCYKNDALGDPMVNESHIAAMEWCSKHELDQMSRYSLEINQIMSAYLSQANLQLIDFKLEYGRLSDGTLVLADEISPDTCRFWDSHTHEKLDKDRFRLDLGGEQDAYQQVMHRLRHLSP